MHHYYILTQDPAYTHVVQFIRSHALRSEVHLNRIRFWVPNGAVYTEFILRFSDCCHYVDPALDLTTGLPVDL